MKTAHLIKARKALQSTIIITVMAALIVSSAPIARAATGDWTSFRNSDANIASTSTALPTSTANAALKWQTAAVASPWGGYYASLNLSPLLIGSYLYTLYGNTLRCTDRNTGTSTSWTIKDISAGTVNPFLSYDEASGLILASVDETTYAADWTPKYTGCIAAIDPKALTAASTSVSCAWKYTPNTSTSYLSSAPLIHDTNIYIGTDSALLKIAFTKSSYTVTSLLDDTFYWDGACIADGYAVIAAQSGMVYAINLSNDKVTSVSSGANNVNSCSAYSDGHIYFTNNSANSGALYAVDFANGTFGTISSCSLGGKSTSTPAIVDGRAFVGVAGTDSTTSITAVDISSMKITYSAATPGYVQSSMLISTATGGPYLYFTANASPGALYVLRDKGNAGTITTVYSPVGTHANSCISSPICSSDGVLYYSNDSATLFAIGAAITSTVSAKPTYTKTGTMKYTDTVTGTSYTTIIPKVSKTATISTKTASRAKKHLSVVWSKGSIYLSGYQIAYKTSTASTWKYTSVSGYRATAKTLKGLKSSKRYRVKIRTYIGKTTTHGSWSKTMTVKVK